jgi:succinate dehydrogenase/fumarate reductase-like Fe-S protein
VSGPDLRIREGVQRGAPFAIRFDDAEIPAYEGESVAAALWAAGIRTWPGATERPPARTFFCAMGICQQCVVWIDGAQAEACRTPASPGLDVRSRPQR